METKPRSIGKHNVKVNMLHVRASNSDLDILNQRAAAMKMPLSTYMLWQSLKPLGQAVKEKEQQDTNKLNYETCLQIRKELNQQNIDLNQITRSLTGQIHSQPIDRILKDIAEIREINRSISRTIAHTRNQ